MTWHRPHFAGRHHNNMQMRSFAAGRNTVAILLPWHGVQHVSQRGRFARCLRSWPAWAARLSPVFCRCLSPPAVPFGILWCDTAGAQRVVSCCVHAHEHARLPAYWSRQRMALNESSAGSFTTLRYIKKKAWSPENITIKFMHNVLAIHARCWGDDICAYARLPGHCSSYITSTNCQQAVYQYLL